MPVCTAFMHRLMVPLKERRNSPLGGFLPLPRTAHSPQYTDCFDFDLGLILWKQKNDMY